MLSLKNFEAQVESKIVTRGFDYYEQDNVEEVEQVGDLEFSANIWGTTEYSVLIKLNPALEVVEHDCDCPYDWGDVCKHKVAVLYYIKDAKLYVYDAKNDDGTLHKIKQDLSKLKKQEIIDLILERAKRNKKFREEVLFELGYEID